MSGVELVAAFLAGFGMGGALGRFVLPWQRSANGIGEGAAHRHGLARSTVKHHLANARSKVGAATRAQLGAASNATLSTGLGGLPTC
ncbi:MAG TPA: hypothetical protein VGK17_17575 [Propionicimonas sp.]|jgi:hypothetical protein